MGKHDPGALWVAMSPLAYMLALPVTPVPGTQEPVTSVTPALGMDPELFRLKYVFTAGPSISA